jgi:hypothetical protein
MTIDDVDTGSEPALLSEQPGSEFALGGAESSGVPSSPGDGSSPTSSRRFQTLASANW